MSNIINDKIHFGLEAETANLKAEIAQLKAKEKCFDEEQG